MSAPALAPNQTKGMRDPGVALHTHGVLQQPDTRARAASRSSAPPNLAGQWRGQGCTSFTARAAHGRGLGSQASRVCMQGALTDPQVVGTALPASPPPAAGAALHLHHLPCPPGFPLGKVGQVQVRPERPRIMAGTKQRGFAQRRRNSARLRCFIAQAKWGAGKGCGGKTGKKPSACSPHH